MPQRPPLSPKDAARTHVKKAKLTAYLAATHNFQLWRGESAFGAPKEMTGQEAVNANRKYEQMFFEDRRSNARLWRWLKVGVKPVPKGTTVGEYMKTRRYEQ